MASYHLLRGSMQSAVPPWVVLQSSRGPGHSDAVVLRASSHEARNAPLATAVIVDGCREAAIDVLRALAAWGATAETSHLQLSANDLFRDHVSLARLREGARNDSILLLFNALCVCRLRSLHIVNEEMRHAGCVKLSQWLRTSSASSLQKLDIFGNSVGDEGVAVLVKALLHRAADVTEVDLGCNALTNRSALRLALLPLRSLALSLNEIDQRGAIALMRYATVPTDLDLSSNPIGSSARLESLVAKHRKVSSVNLSQTPFNAWLEMGDFHTPFT